MKKNHSTKCVHLSFPTLNTFWAPKKNEKLGAWRRLPIIKAPIVMKTPSKTIDQHSEGRKHWHARLRSAAWLGLRWCTPRPSSLRVMSLNLTPRIRNEKKETHKYIIIYPKCSKYPVRRCLGTKTPPSKNTYRRDWSIMDN